MKTRSAFPLATVLAAAFVATALLALRRRLRRPGSCPDPPPRSPCRRLSRMSSAPCPRSRASTATTRADMPTPPAS